MTRPRPISMKLIDSTLRKNSVTTRLERDSTRLLAAQYDVQQKLLTLVNDLNTVYQITRNSLITMATDEIATLLHLSARTLQRANNGAVAIFHQKVVDVSELTPDLHPMALQRLEDIEGIRKWSLERHTRPWACAGRNADVCSTPCPKLLAAAKDVLPQGEPATNSWRATWPGGRVRRMSYRSTKKLQTEAAKRMKRERKAAKRAAREVSGTVHMVRNV